MALAKDKGMDVKELLHAKREDILRTAARHGASNVRVFGSVARGEAGPSSDIDFLVELAPDRSLLDQVALLQEWLSRRACTGTSATGYSKRPCRYER